MCPRERPVQHLAKRSRALIKPQWPIFNKLVQLTGQLVEWRGRQLLHQLCRSAKRNGERSDRCQRERSPSRAPIAFTAASTDAAAGHSVPSADVSARPGVERVGA